MLDELIEDGLDNETATLKVLDKKEKELDSIMFLGNPKLSIIVRKIGHSLVKGPMDAFLKR
jgi:hypothetical protein